MVTLLANTQPASPDAAVDLAWLTMGFIALTIVVIVAFVVFLSLRRGSRLRREADRTTPTEKGVDAWEEAGKRAEPETVDLDPDELGPDFLP